jgi:hypothetical protein
MNYNKPHALAQTCCFLFLSLRSKPLKSFYRGYGDVLLLRRARRMVGLALMDSKLESWTCARTPLNTLDSGEFDRALGTAASARKPASPLLFKPAAEKSPGLASHTMLLSNC